MWGNNRPESLMWQGIQNKLPECITMKILTVEQRSNENLSFLCVCMCVRFFNWSISAFFRVCCPYFCFCILSNIFRYWSSSFPFLFSSLPPSCLTPSPLALPSFPFRMGQVTYRPEQIMAHQVEAEPRSSPCIKGGRGNPPRGTGSQQIAKCQGLVLFTLLEALSGDQVTKFSQTFRRPQLVPCRLPNSLLSIFLIIIFHFWV